MRSLPPSDSTNHSISSSSQEIVPTGWVERLARGVDTSPMNPAWIGNKRGLGSTKVLLSKSEQRQPRRILGSDDSGRREVLSTMAKGAIDNGQGLVYVDGFGGHEMLHQLCSFAEQAHRLEDVRVINLFQDGVGVSMPELDHLYSPGVRHRGLTHLVSNTFNPLEGQTLATAGEWLLPFLKPDGDEELGGLTWDNCLILVKHWLALMFSAQQGSYGPLDMKWLSESLTMPSMHLITKDKRLSGALRKNFLGAWQMVFGSRLDEANSRADFWLTTFKKRWDSLSFLRGWEAPHDSEHVYSSEFSWVEALEKRHLVLVLVPKVEHLSRRHIQALQMLLQQLGSTAKDVFTPWTAAGSARGMWVFDDVRYYLNQEILSMVHQGTIWGITTVWGDQALRPTDSNTMFEELLLSCPIQAFLKNAAPSEYFKSRFNHSFHYSLNDLRDGEGLVTIYDQWTPIRMAHQEAVPSKPWLFHPNPSWKRSWTMTPPWRSEGPDEEG